MIESNVQRCGVADRVEARVADMTQEQYLGSFDRVLAGCALQRIRCGRAKAGNQKYGYASELSGAGEGSGPNFGKCVPMRSPRGDIGI